MSSFKPGDRVFVKGWPPVSLEVVSIDDPSIVTLQSAHGVLVKVGRLAVVGVNEQTTEQATRSPSMAGNRSQ